MASGTPTTEWDILEHPEVFEKVQFYFFSGKMGTGKNYLGEIVLPEVISLEAPIAYLNFADALKVQCATEHQIDPRPLYHGHKTTEQRRMLQTTGAAARSHQEDHWIRALALWCWRLSMVGPEQCRVRTIVVCDCRYQNELKWARSLPRTRVIRVVAPTRNRLRLLAESSGDEAKFESFQMHQSETDLDAIEFEHVILNDFQYEATVKDDLHRCLEL